MNALAHLDDWPVDTVAAAVVTADGSVVDSHGDLDRRFALASVTKLLSAHAIAVAVEEEAIALSDAAGPPGSTVEHLLAHASGLAFDEDAVEAGPGEKRIYSNQGYAVLAAHLTDATGIDFADYLRDAVCAPLSMSSTTLDGPAGHGATSSVADLARLAADLLTPRLIAPATHAAMTTVHFPGLDGFVPGYGRHSPNDWGLGPEIRGEKSPHWTGTRTSPTTFGHFGQSGTFLWVDPDRGAACVVLTDRTFGSWAKPLWSDFSDAVVAELTD
ncbi:serine hydrolase domain-containing protein [Williamsia deligens]|uniref:Serine hydrolase domain-containing protein n=1 Tax=Williamsia deligens TaxID=321325 RepID=A0ABW3GD90_9NOCA|nr:serine hydrolase domain-containing protein [Williamsia deligens]MCP2195759.1 CubicO group peptidase, beta-lactamase class C family [Williamsia deligens]